MELIEPLCFDKTEQEAQKIREELLKFTKFGEPEISQGIRTNGACETLNSILKRDSNNSILNYIQILYDKIYNVLMNMEKEADDKLTNFARDHILSYNNDTSIRNVTLRDNIVYVTEIVNMKTYVFQVINNDGELSCSCKNDILFGIGCIHIYYAIKHFFKDCAFENTIHPCYFKQNIVDFIHKLPQHKNLRDLKKTEGIKPPVNRNKKLKATRYKCAIDMVIN